MDQGIDSDKDPYELQESGPPTEDECFPSVPRSECRPYRNSDLALYEFEFYEDVLLHPFAIGVAIYVQDSLLSFGCHIEGSGGFRAYFGDGTPFRLEYETAPGHWIPCDPINGWFMNRISERLLKNRGVLFKDGNLDTLHQARLFGLI